MRSSLLVVIYSFSFSIDWCHLFLFKTSILKGVSEEAKYVFGFDFVDYISLTLFVLNTKNNL